MIKERKLVKIAKVGNVIEFKNGLTGIVEKVNENSVIVDVTIMDNYRDLELDSLTVVNHKNYKIIKDSI
ncbi:YkvS family protein [Pseudomonas sp. ISL-88]|nr:YkvS family protein [Pseudomonas sp. ISL-88]